MEADFVLTAKVTISVVLGGFVLLFLHLYNVLILKPKRLRSRLLKQGIGGPSPSFLFGNIPEIKTIQLQAAQAAATKDEKKHVLSHNWPSDVFPHLKQWQNQYGPIFMYSSGGIQLLCITDVEMAKELGLSTSLRLGKPSYLSKDLGPLLGQGILSSSGPLWAHQRKIIAPQLYLNKVKGMVSLMVDSTTSMLSTWDSRIEGGEISININEDLRSLSADMISRACFGNNYKQGEEIFLKIRTLQKVMSKGNVGVPGSRYVPSKNNREIWRLEKEIHIMILDVVKKRTEAAHKEEDLLQMILEGGKTYSAENGLSSEMSQDKFIVDNCKNIYFAGHETTAITASWCLMLLAAHPEWQAWARAEVLEFCRDGSVDADMLRSLKTVTMVIQETLRLYPPAVFVTREALQDIQFKHLLIPKGTDIRIPIPMLQQCQDLWGPDSHQFNPERFANGVLQACKNPQAYMPFGVGPRICVGQHFAMAELKVVLSLILSRFSFSISSAYQHAPAFRLVVEPGHGVILNMKRV